MLQNYPLPTNRVFATNENITNVKEQNGNVLRDSPDVMSGAGNNANVKELDCANFYSARIANFA